MCVAFPSHLLTLDLTLKKTDFQSTLFILKMSQESLYRPHRICIVTKDFFTLLKTRQLKTVTSNTECKDAVCM